MNIRPTFRARIRTWRLARAEMALADAEHYFNHWVEPFDRRLGAVPPSQMKREQKKLDRLRARVRHHGGNPDE